MLESVFKSVYSESFRQECLTGQFNLQEFLKARVMCFSATSPKTVDLLSSSQKLLLPQIIRGSERQKESD